MVAISQQTIVFIISNDTTIFLNNIYKADKIQKCTTDTILFEIDKITIKRQNCNSPIIIKLLLLPIKNKYQVYDTSKVVRVFAENSYSDISLSSQLTNFEGSGYFSRSINFGNTVSPSTDNLTSIEFENSFDSVTYLKFKANTMYLNNNPDNNAEINSFQNINITIKYKDISTEAGSIYVRDTSALNYLFNINGLKIDSKNFSTALGFKNGRSYYQKIVPKTGVQGPYFLFSEHNHNFSIIPNTLRLYINGILMKENYDFVVDYNLATITFTGITITTDLIIEAFFQYYDFSSSQAFYDINQNLKYKNYSIYFSFKQILTPKKSFFNAIPPSASLWSNTDSLIILSSYIPTNSSNIVLYEKKDTIIDNIKTAIFVYSTDSTKQLYYVNFTFVGDTGSYKIAYEAVNGRIFKFVGKNKGNYSPVIIIPKPIDSKFFIFKLNNDNLAFHTILNNNTSFFPNKQETYGFYLNFFLKQKNLYFNFKHFTKNFRNLERIYTKDFLRKWTIEEPQEHSYFTVRYNSKIFVSELNSIICYNIPYYGLNQTFNFSLPYLNSNFSFFVYRKNKSFGLFQHSSTNLNLPIKKFVFSLNFKNDLSKNFVDSAKNFSNYQLFCSIKTTDTLNFIEFSYKYIYFTELLKETNNIFSLKYSKKHENFSTDNSIVFILSKNDSITFSNSVLFNHNNVLTILRDRINIISNIKIGKVQKPIYQYIFVPAPLSVATHKWIDYNKDNIMQNNEFETANYPDEAKFVKIPLKTENFQKLNNTKLSNQFLATLISNSKVNSNFISSIDYEIISDKIINPMTINTENLNAVWGLTLIYKKINIDNSVTLAKNHICEFYGKETMQNFSFLTKTEYNINPNFKLTFLATTKNILKSKDYSIYHNFNYKQNTYTTQLTNSIENLESSLSYSLSFFKTNTNNLLAEKNQINLTFNYTSGKQKNLLKLSYIKNLVYSTNPALIYEINEGVTHGNNYIIENTFTYDLNKWLSVKLTFIGRYNKNSHAKNFFLITIIGKL